MNEFWYTLLGVVLSFVYLGLVMGLAQLISRKDSDFARRFIYIMVSNWWLIAVWFFTEAFMAAIVPFSFVFVNALTYKYGFFRSKDRKGHEDLGMVYYAISLLIVTVVSFTFDVTYVGALAILIMGYGDTSATAVGRRFPLYSYKAFGSKTSLGGNLAMLAVSLAIAAIVLTVSGHFSLLAVVTIAVVATLAEAFTPMSFDNLSVPLITFIYYLLFFL